MCSDEPQCRNLRERNPAQKEDIYGLGVAAPAQRLSSPDCLGVAFLDDAKGCSAGTLDHVLEPEPARACRAGRVHGRGRGGTGAAAFD